MPTSVLAPCKVPLALTPAFLVELVQNPVLLLSPGDEALLTKAPALDLFPTSPRNLSWSLTQHQPCCRSRCTSCKWSEGGLPLLWPEKVTLFVWVHMNAMTHIIQTTVVYRSFPHYSKVSPLQLFPICLSVSPSSCPPALPPPVASFTLKLAPPS